MVRQAGSDLLDLNLTHFIKCKINGLINIKFSIFNRMRCFIVSRLQTWIIICSIEFMNYTLNEFRR